MKLGMFVRKQWDRTLGGGLFLIGGLALLLGWLGVAGEALTARQIPYVISGGLGGLFLLGLGAVFWLSADMRDEWRQLDAIGRSLERGQSSRDEEAREADDDWGDVTEVTDVIDLTDADMADAEAQVRPLRSTNRPIAARS